MRYQIALSAVLNGVGALAPQIVALLSLGNVAFGQFSVGYLAFSLASSMLLSILCDSWVIVPPEQRSGGWSAYSRLLTTISIVFGLLCGIIGLLFVDIAFGLATAACVLLATYRAGTRYLLFVWRRWREAIFSDSLVIAATLGVFFASSALFGPSTWTVMAAWGGGSLAGSLVIGLPRFGPLVAMRWVRENGRTIGPLVADAALMDVSAIGTPYLLLPQLGYGGFGLYRAISNLAAPLRLLLTPLRPLILAAPRRSLAWRFTVMIFAIGLCGGAAMAGVLFGLMHSGLTLGMLTGLGPFWFSAGLYGLATLLLIYYSMLCRAFGQPRVLLSGRVTQTILGVFGPTLGFLLGDVPGAILGFAVASLASGFAWIFLAFYAARRSRRLIREESAAGERS